MKLDITEIYSYAGYSTSQMQGIAREVEAEGIDATPIYYRRPDAALDPKDFLKAMPLSEVPYIIPDAFAGSNGVILVEGLSLSQLQEIGIEGDEYLKEAIKIALEKTVSAKPEDEHIKELKRYLDFSPAWQI